VVCAQRYDNESKATVPEDPSSSVIVFPCTDNVLVFDGSLAHGVIHGPPAGTRMTLLVNWWVHHPQDIPQVHRDILQNSGIQLLNSADLQKLKAAASSCRSKQLQHARVELSRFLQDGDAELVK
jgi:hypothetical protein